MLSIHRIITAASVALTLAVPATAAAAQPDGRSTSARDYAQRVSPGEYVLRGHDLHAARSGNSTDYVLRGHDLHAARSGDGTDYALRGHDLHAARSGDRTVVNSAAKAPGATPARNTVGGFNWSDAAIGALGALAVVAAIGGLSLLTVHYRQPREGARGDRVSA